MLPLPRARRVTYNDTFGGREDSQRIEVEGVVHSARLSKLFERDILLLNVELGGGEMRVLLQDFMGIDSNRLIDSTVRVRGVCSTSFNQKRQFVSVKRCLYRTARASISSDPRTMTPLPPRSDTP